MYKSWVASLVTHYRPWGSWSHVTRGSVILQALWIRVHQRIPPHIPKAVKSPIKPNRIILRIPALCCQIVSIVVVELPGFGVCVLPGKPEVKHHSRVGGVQEYGLIRDRTVGIRRCPQDARGLVIPEGRVRPLPDGFGGVVFY